MRRSGAGRDGADALSSRHLLVATVITLVDLVVIVGIGIYLLACTQFLQYKSIESFGFRCFFGAGGVTRTHDLLLTNYDSFVSPISVNARKVLCCKASGVFVFRGISPIWAGFG